MFEDNIGGEVEKRLKGRRIIKKISKKFFSTELSPHAKQSIQEREQQLQPKILQTSISSKKKSGIQKKSTIRIQKQKSKSKVRSLNPLTGRTRLYLKRLEENNSKQNSFRQCKRLQDSFCSETNPNLPSANPANRSCRGFTDQLRNIPSVREGSNRRGGYVSVSLLEQPFPCPRTFRGEASYESLTFKQIRSKSKIQDGEHFTYKDILKPNSFLTKIDLKDAFYSIPIAKKSRKYLQFICNNKLYQFCVLPFGISTAPRVFPGF